MLARLHEWVVTVDHKRLGIMYVGVGLVFLLVAGLEATLMRWQLAFPDNTVLSPQVFNRLFTMHGTTMVFFVGIPIVFGFANYLVPLMIDARPGLSAAERFRVLAVVLQRPAPLL